jgi:ATP-dependent Clp protease, protease subunit
MQISNLDKKHFYDMHTRFIENRNLVLYDEIYSEDAQFLLKSILFLNSISESKPINLYICSNGGEVDSGIAIYDMIQWIPAPVYTIGMGNCASMAAILLMSGRKRFIFPHCWVMLHQSSAGIWGDTDTTVARAAMMERQEKQMLKIQSRHTGQTTGRIAKDTVKEKWFNAKEAVKYGIVDEIIKPYERRNGKFHGNEKRLVDIKKI